ncbi:hypothetical protein DIURU_003297 [Diutina rugosa]|uniref:non-specific serine/threonine protein kinase n=1 Tax=Diutina rugosa TaxID=5481 RepID=A0A642UNN3_DIURU|nr:uncharacterized protein DIURU_003297 [Diutina rugosa]KAA8901352.1 hypothetical protein DIURU_003297 [Diutina rugosa]
MIPLPKLISISSNDNLGVLSAVQLIVYISGSCATGVIAIAEYHRALMTTLRERQHDEVSSIESIYGDTFVDITSQNKVWNQDPSPHFQVTVASDADPDHPEVSVVLDIEFTQTYPLSPPIVKVLHPKNLLRARIAAIEAKIKELIKEYPEQEVGFIIISEVKFMVDEFHSTTEKVLSLEQERELRLQQQRLELEQREQALARQQEVERHREEMEVTKHIANIDDEDTVSVSVSDLVPASGTGYDYFVFDQTMTAEVYGTRRQFPFRAVSGFIGCRKRDLLASVAAHSYIVKPYIAPSLISEKDRGSEVSYLLLEIDFLHEHWSSDDGKREIHQLEAELAQVAQLRHTNLQRLLGFQIDKVPEGSGWRLRVLTEFSPSSEVLSELLRTAEYINWGLARNWLIQLLPALETLHQAGLAHRQVCPLAVSVAGDDDDSSVESEGTKVVKLCHPQYGQRIVSMLTKYPNPGAVTPNPDPMPQAWRHPDTTITSKTDIWDLGVLFIRVMLNYTVLETTYPTPDTFVAKFDPQSYGASSQYAEYVYDMLCKMLTPKAAKRPSALELNALQFLREGPNLNQSSSAVESDSDDETPAVVNRRLLAVSGMSKRRYSNQDDSSDASFEPPEVGGRYRREFEEVGRLGKGGFGEVVKARSRIEGSFYAVKKIRYKSHKLESLLSEVLSLARLNHPHIVRYYGAWFEEAPSASAIASDSEEDSGSISDDEDDESSQFDSQFTSRRSFSVGYFNQSYEQSFYESDAFEFARASDDDNDNNDDDETSTEPSIPARRQVLPRHRRRSMTQAVPQMLYIQMELCENNTLSDLIQQGLPSNKNEYWRLFRQILDAVAYIHSEGFIHRDLKPKNIFIDRQNNVKVGDFGLAKSSQLASASVTKDNQVKEGPELSTVVGTVFYMANEVATGDYDAKVDMYSLGVIFFEMCWPMTTGMERAHILNQLRLARVEFPEGFSEAKFGKERKIVRSLLDHDPQKRPEARQLLQSGLLPVEPHDPVVQEALRSLTDPASPWQAQVRQALFSRPYSVAADVVFDGRGGLKPQSEVEAVSFECMVSQVSEIFEVHGAVQDHEVAPVAPQPPPQYQNTDQFKVLDRSGAVLTLPFDLTLPLARQWGRSPAPVPKVWRHNYVYRAPTTRQGGGGAPKRYSTMAFDIGGFDHPPRTIQAQMYEDAECLSVIDAVAQAFPGFSGDQGVLLVNHYSVLDAVVQFAFSSAIDRARTHEVMAVLAQLGVDATSDDIKRSLRQEFGAPHTVVHDLVDSFNFTVDVASARQKLARKMVDSAAALKVERAMAYVADVVKLAQKMGLKTPIYFNPLANYNASYYGGNIMFQWVCRVDKARRFSRVATGGRYDALIRSLAARDVHKQYTPHGVGFSLSTHLMHIILKQSWPKTRHFSAHNVPPRLQWQGQRVRVLINVTSEPAVLDSSVEILKSLWRRGVSCDRYHSMSNDDFAHQAWVDGAEYVVLIRQPKGKASARGFRPLRVRCVATGKDVDVDYDEIGDFLSSETGTSPMVATRPGLPSFESTSSLNEAQMVQAPVAQVEVSQKVVVVENMAPRGRKNRKDKYSAEIDAQAAAANYVEQVAGAKVIAVALRDEVIDMMAQTSIASEDEWVRKVIYSTKDLPKSYAMSIYNIMVKEKAKGSSLVLLVSQRTQKTVVVDLTRGD